MKATLAIRCVDVPQTEVNDLHALYESDREICFSTFARHVDWRPIAEQMGYVTVPTKRGLRLSQDRLVRYYVSAWKGEKCFHMDHSSVDFVFTFKGKQNLPISPWH
jgi:hypothetical protein